MQFKPSDAAEAKDSKFLGIDSVLEEGCYYEGIYFKGYVPIWVRPPDSGERCPWTSLSHGGFYDWIDWSGRRVIYYKFNPDTPTGTRLYWLPSLLSTFRGQEFGPGNPYDGDLERRKVLFPPIPTKFIRAPGRGENCPWTGLSQSAFLTVQKRYGRKVGFRAGNHEGRGTTLVWLPDLFREMMRDAENVM